MPKILLLDIGGVLLVDPMLPLHDRLSDFSGSNAESLWEYYRANLRHDLWSGSLPEREFWNRLCGEAGVAPEGWREWLMDAMEPLVDADHLGTWAKRARIWALSNHRSEWVLPVLEDAGLLDHIERSYVSSDTGEVKPEEEAYRRIIADAGGRAEDVLFVDDKTRNLKVAAELGMGTLLADPDGAWKDAVDELWAA